MRIPLASVALDENHDEDDYEDDEHDEWDDNHVVRFRLFLLGLRSILLLHHDCDDLSTGLLLCC